AVQDQARAGGGNLAFAGSEEGRACHGKRAPRAETQGSGSASAPIRSEKTDRIADQAAGRENGEAERAEGRDRRSARRPGELRRGAKGRPEGANRRPGFRRAGAGAARSRMAGAAAEAGAARGLAGRSAPRREDVGAARLI